MSLLRHNRNCSNNWDRSVRVLWCQVAWLSQNSQTVCRIKKFQLLVKTIPVSYYRNFIFFTILIIFQPTSGCSFKYVTVFIGDTWIHGMWLFPDSEAWFYSQVKFSVNYCNTLETDSFFSLHFPMVIFFLNVF